MSWDSLRICAFTVSDLDRPVQERCTQLLWPLMLVAISTVKLPTVQLPIKLAYLVNLTLVSPFSNYSMHLYMGGPIVTFFPTKDFWIKSTMIINSSGIPELNLGILIIYLPEVLLPGVL